ncbi:hypothetical protein ACWCO3_15760 [Micromonospora sp. NPDC002411]
MDRFEGRCWLDWWANPITLLVSEEVFVVIVTAGTGWAAHGRLLSDDDDEREGSAFLCDLDPVFVLRFEDGSTVDVTVHPTDGHHRFALTEYDESVGHPVEHHAVL